MSVPTEPTPATYDFPPGTPAEVPADFDAEAMKRELAQLRAAQAGQLSPEEVAEFRQLREDKRKADAEAAAEAERQAALRQPDRHHVHLADGTTVDGSTIETHYADESGALIPVTGAWLRPEYVTAPPEGG